MKERGDFIFCIFLSYVTDVSNIRASVTFKKSIIAYVGTPRSYFKVENLIFSLGNGTHLKIFLHHVVLNDPHELVSEMFLSMISF